jgi:hypothetical protein
VYSPRGPSRAKTYQKPWQKPSPKNGKTAKHILIKDSKVLTMNEEKIINEAQKAAEEVCDKAVDDYMRANSVLAKAVKKNLL